MKKSAFYFFIFSVVFLSACGSGSKYDYVANPVDEEIKLLDKEKTYSIVLYDMDVDENDVFKHKYKIITNMTDSVNKKEEITDWQTVDKDYFMQNENNLGLELAAKSEDGKVHKTPAPPGYSNYVGNEKYGQWKTDNSGNSFWAFYGQYMFMSSMFNMMSSPVYRGGYNTYRNDYYGQRPYYGTTGKDGSTQYGTNSATARKTNPTFFDRNKNNVSSFKNKVQSSVTRSNARTKASSSSSSKSKSSGGTTRTRSSGGRRR